MNRKYALIHGNVFTGDKETILEDYSIFIEGDRIKKIAPSTDVVNGIYEVYDISGKYVMPGLINLHAHLFGSGKQSKVLNGGKLQKLLKGFVNTTLPGHKIADMKVEKHLKQSLNAGVTTIIGDGDFSHLALRVRDRINEGKIDGPSLIVPGVAVTCIGGHGSELDDETVNLFKEKKAALVVTISSVLPLAKLPKEITGFDDLCEHNPKILLDTIISGGKKAIFEGIPVGLGTDESSPIVTPYSMWKEVYYFAKYCGVSNAFALETATFGNASIIHIEEETGSIAEGKLADILVLNSNPLEDLQALSDINMIFNKGKLLQKPYVKRNKKVDKWISMAEDK